VRRLILSDIHSNWEALEAVLEDARGRYDQTLCCGDLVGYGASPNQVLKWAARAVTLVVRGNHDKACCGLEDLDCFNDVARAAAEWTFDEVGSSGQKYLRELPRGPLITEEFILSHGSPLDEDEYLVNDSDVAGLDNQLDRRMSFIGHTHLQGGWFWHYGGYSAIWPPRSDEPEIVLELDRDSLYLLNPGSIGQPRDGDPRAAYLLWDDEARLVTFRRVRYDIEKAQKRIRKAHLPELLASRLAIGR
jgi:diadenosine tetraphosphatase ApaH/serine/threonine PP2A family protein phosphatase